MNPRTTGILLLVALALWAFLYFYELEGEGARQQAEERAKRIFADLEAAEVDWIALRTTDGVDARFERAEGGWRVSEPLSFPADAAVERMADTLASAVHGAAFESPQPDAEYGLDEASARIVRFGAGGAEHELRLGRETPVGASVYVKTGDSPSVRTIAGYHAKAFERSLTDLRRKQILGFDPSTVEGLEASWPGGRVALARAAEEGGEETWRMTAPVEARGDDEAIDRLLSTLSYLRADGFVDAPSDAERARLDPPDFAVVLRAQTEGGEGNPVTLAIGRPDGAGLRLARAGDETVLFQIATDRLEDFPREAMAYRDRTLARFAPSDARRVDFFFQDAAGDPLAIHAERGGEGWTAEPEAFAPGMFSNVIAELSRLEGEEVLAESMGEAELEALGLSPPRTTITVLGAEPEPDPEAAGDLPPPAPRIAEVHFGDVTPEGVAARAVGDPVVYRLALDAAEQLPVSLEAFRNRFRAQPEEEPPSGGGPGLGPEDPVEESP